MGGNWKKLKETERHLKKQEEIGRNGKRLEETRRHRKEKLEF